MMSFCGPLKCHIEIAPQFGPPSTIYYDKFVIMELDKTLPAFAVPAPNVVLSSDDADVADICWGSEQ
jgi:hypothetical protein